MESDRVRVPHRPGQIVAAARRKAIHMIGVRTASGRSLASTKSAWNSSVRGFSPKTTTDPLKSSTRTCVWARPLIFAFESSMHSSKPRRSHPSGSRQRRGCRFFRLRRFRTLTLTCQEPSATAEACHIREAFAARLPRARALRLVPAILRNARFVYFGSYSWTSTPPGIAKCVTKP